MDDYCGFVNGKLKILVGFKNSKAVLLMYQKVDKSPMRKDEILDILRFAVSKPDWVLISGDNPNPRWRLGDASAYAYYYPQPDFDGAPAQFVRVQTATLDAIYTKLRQHEIKPTDPETPLFEVFAPIPMKADYPKVTFDDKQPLLTVFAVRDLILAGDQKGVMLGLNDKDAITFAALTHKYNDQLLILKATDTAVEVMHITAPIEDGYIGFKHPESAALAEYLRRRFHIAEFK